MVSTDSTLLQLCSELPMGSGAITVLSMNAIVVTMLFSITSPDSCSLVVDVLGHGGRSETPRTNRAFWSLRDVPPEAVSAPSASGAVSLDEKAAPRDPLGGEVFDTPEFRSSAAGAAHEDSGADSRASSVGAGAAH